MQKIEHSFCCNDFYFATQRDSDNEGYGKLLYRLSKQGEWLIGSMSDPIKFCPWCGKELMPMTSHEKI